MSLIEDAKYKVNGARPLHTATNDYTHGPAL
jgi:hypothetical protein